MHLEQPDSRLRILVVEDEALIAENLRQALEGLGYEVPATYYTFAEALAGLTGPAAVPADLVLLDLNLGEDDPELTGLTLARHLREAGGPPFIFLTAYTHLDTIRQATRLAPSGYLLKPVNGPALFAAIQSALEYAATRQPAPAPSATPPPIPDFFYVKLRDQSRKLYWTNIQRLEVGKNYVTLYVAGQRSGYPLRGTLTYVLDQLVPAAIRPRFLRVSRRLALNAASITAHDEEYIYCGTERYENGQLAQEQLQELKLK